MSDNQPSVRPDMLPPLGFSMHPMRILGGFWHFCECWFLSREFPQAVPGVPFFLCASGCLATVLWLRSASTDDVVARLERAITAAAARNDESAHDNYLHALITLRPGESEYRLRYGDYLVRKGVAAGVNQIRALTPEGRDGYGPAHLWLVRNAIGEKPLIQMTADELRRHLQLTVKQMPDNAESHALLAQLYARDQEWFLAEQHLAVAAKQHPKYNLELARLQLQIRREKDQVDGTLALAAREFQSRVERDSSDQEARLGLAEVMVLQEKKQDARALLLKGLSADAANPKLRRAVSNLELSAAADRMNESHLNRDSAQAMILQALATDPGNPLAVEQLERISALAQPVQPEVLQPAIDYWTEQLAAAPENQGARLLLTSLLSLSSNYKLAAETIQPIAGQNAHLQRMHARLLINDHRRSEADDIIAALLNQQRADFEHDAASESLAAELAETMLVVGESDEVVRLIRTMPHVDDSPVPSNAQLRRLYGQACIRLFDERLAVQAAAGDDPTAVTLNNHAKCVTLTCRRKCSPT